MKRINPYQRVRHLVITAGWTMFDQFLFALSNLVITLAVARGGGADTLGSFGVAFAAYLIALGCSRALVSQPLLTLRSQHWNHDRTAEAASNTLTALFATAAAVVTGSLGLLLGRVEFLIVAAVLPITLLQDVLRYQAFRRKTPFAAVLLDGGWLIGSLAAWPLVMRTASAGFSLLCWAGGALIGIGFGWRHMRPRLARVQTAVAWWRHGARDLATPLLLDSTLYSLSAQAVVFIVAAIEGDSEYGVLRAGQIFFAPLGLVLTALGLLLAPYLADRQHAATSASALRIGASTAAMTAIICLMLMMAEPMLRRILFGSSINVPGALLIPLALQAVIIGASTGPTVVTLARRRATDMARSRLTSAIVGLAFLAWTTVQFGVIGAAWALVAQTACYTAHLGLRVKRADWAHARAMINIGRVTDA